MMMCFCIFNFANSPQECTRNYLRRFKNPKYSGGGGHFQFCHFTSGMHQKNPGIFNFAISPQECTRNYIRRLKIQAFSILPFHLRNAPETISEGLKIQNILGGGIFNFAISPQECTRNYIRRFKNPGIFNFAISPQECTRNYYIIITSPSIEMTRWVSRCNCQSQG